MKNFLRKILFKIADITNCGTPDRKKENFISVDKNLKKELTQVKRNNEGEFETLYDYYKIQYPKDLEIFKDACSSPNYNNDKERNICNVHDLENLKKSRHPLLRKKHFIYFLSIHTAFLMTVHKHFNDKYEKFKIMNKGIVFEYGLTNTFMYPWKILERLRVPFNKELFSNCLGLVISEMMTDYHFCDIIPRDFMDKFIDDPDLNNPKTPYGKEWKEIAEEEWFQVIKSICPKIK